MAIKEIMKANKVLFKFECEDCGDITHIDIYEVLSVGHPLCCDEEMEIDDGCYREL